MSPPTRHDALLGIAAGDDVGASRWVLVDQQMIDRFAEVTLDPDPMHIDPEWAKANGPFGGSIAFGFLTVSLLTHLLHLAMGTRPDKESAGEGHYLNYGFDRLRLVAPVPAGSKVRGRFTKQQAELDEKGRWLTRFGCVMEIEGVERPALVADWLTIWVPGEIH